MREEIPSETTRATKPSKFSDQNQPPKSHNQNQIPKPIAAAANPSRLRSASSWGSQIVKNLAGEKKTRASQVKKHPLSSSSSTTTSDKSNGQRAKRSLIGDLACSVNPTQVHPQQSFHRRQSSRDLFNELDHLRTLLQESKEREFKLQVELSESKRNARVTELETELERLKRRAESLEEEKASLSSGSSFSSEENNDGSEIEVVELRRLNKELQLQKRNMACRLASLESQLASSLESSETDIVAKTKAEATSLRHANEDLCKQVEGLQMSRLNEVEELAYLRWVNSCLRNELRSGNSVSNPNSSSSEEEPAGPLLPCQSNDCIEFSSAKRLNLIKKLKKWPLTEEDLSNLERPDCLSEDKNWVDEEERRSPRRRHSISGSKISTEDPLVPNKRRQSDAFISAKELEMEMEKETEPSASQFYGNCHEILKLSTSFDVEKRALRIPNPPPRPSCSVSTGVKDESQSKLALLPPPLPPPPPPPPKFAARSIAGTFQRAPQVVEFYHSLMKRDSRKDSLNGGVCDAPDVANVRSNMIGEIENRSSHLLAIKADVETQGEFVNSLIREVNGAVYRNIEDVVEFVKWLDDELCFLVDERAVLKHFDWPERKADTLREAAFGYKDIKRLESEVSSYKDDPRLPCDIALKKLVALSEKMERTVYNLLRTKESTLRNCKEFQIPTDWMLDNGIISNIKIGSVKLAKMYMKRVATELQSKAASEKDPAMDYMLLQGVRFAFRIHQFAGGFDAETMHAFEELRNLACLLNKM